MDSPEIKVHNSGVIVLKKIVDANDGILCIGENESEIPFPIKRFYFITNLQHTISERGKHAHRQLSQVIFCVNGSFTLTLDDGTNCQSVRMEKGPFGILLGPKLWHTMHDFSNDCSLLVIASDYYDEADYIRDYEVFKNLVRKE